MTATRTAPSTRPRRQGRPTRPTRQRGTARNADVRQAPARAPGGRRRPERPIMTTTPTTTTTTTSMRPEVARARPTHEERASAEALHKFSFSSAARRWEPLDEAGMTKLGQNMLVRGTTACPICPKSTGRGSSHRMEGKRKGQPQVRPLCHFQGRPGCGLRRRSPRRGRPGGGQGPPRDRK